MTIDLTTQYGGLTLKTPIVVGACPMTANEMMRVALIAAGAGAIVLPSLFEEQIRRWDGDSKHTDGLGKDLAQSALEREGDNQSKVVADAGSYLALVKRATSSGSIPVIASMNGQCAGKWLDFAVQLETAGASAIEFNIRRPSPHSYTDPREVEDAIDEAAARISQIVSIPLFLKLGRHYTSLSHLAQRLLKKVDGLVLFGYAPEFDISMDSLQAETCWGLSEPGSVARSIESIMRVHSFCPEMPIAAGGGIGSANDVAKVLLAGADAAMITSAAYRDGPDVIASWLDTLKLFMQRHDMRSLADLKARRPICFDHHADRSGYINALSTPPAPDMIRSANRTFVCDRWGHIRTAE